MRRALVVVAAAILAAGLLLAKLAGVFGDDAARSAITKLGSKSPSAESLALHGRPRLPGGGVPEVVPPATDDGFRTAGTSIDDEVVDAVQVWGESACAIVGYVETMHGPPTWDGLLMAYGLAGVRAFDEARALYAASENLAVGEPSLGEIREFYCAAGV